MTKACNFPIPNTAIAFDKVYAQLPRPPWDVDGPTPFVQDLAQSGGIRGEILDVGCGTGENAMFLAGQGYRVVALDGAPAAIEKARTKAFQRGVDVEFLVADARDLPAWDQRFETMIDSGLFHVMDKSVDRLRYASALRRVSSPGAVLHLLAFKEQGGPVWLSRITTRLRVWRSGFGTHGVTDKEIRDAFAQGWRIESIAERVYGWGAFYLARIARI